MSFPSRSRTPLVMMSESAPRTSSVSERAELKSKSLSSQAPGGRLPLEPMDPQLTTIQPGGGVIIHLEKFWGRFRRTYLRIFRRGYIKQMAALRQGEKNPCPHAVLDPRDMKFYQNQPGGYYWKPEDDPFRWRDNLPFARSGLAELFVFSVLMFGGAIGLGALIIGRGWSGLGAQRRPGSAWRRFRLSDC